MTEQYGFQFKVDATDAARGWKQFESAVEGVFKALDKMESHVEKTMGKVNDTSRKAASGIKAFAAAGQALNGLKFSGSSGKNIASLNAAMKQFKAPSAAQVKNLQAFFRALTLAGTGGGAAAARNISTLKNAVNGFKAPSATNVRNIRDFFSALSTFRNNGLSNAAGMFASLNQISRFKAPSATQVKNLQNFLNAVSGLQIPRNGAQIARVLEQIARAASMSNQHLRGLRGNLGSFNWNRFNSGTRQARVEMMGLQNAFKATYQIGSVLRSLLGSLTIAELGRSFFEADNRLVTFSASMKVVNKDASAVNDELSFITKTATDLGLAYGSAVEAYGKFAISANKAGASAAQARDIFQGFGTAMTVMGLSADRQGDVMLALQQSLNKGYIAGEELNQQLNEHLPGALGYLREELKKTGISLETALEKKMLDSTQTLLFLASKYREEFGPVLAEALERPSAQMNILRTNITKLFEAVGKNGGNQGFVTFLKRINAYMRPEDIERYGKAIGEMINRYMNKLADAVDWLAKNWDDLKGPLSTALSLLGKWMIISGMLKIGTFLVSPLINTTGALVGLIPKLQQAVLLFGALRAATVMGPPTQLAAMNASTLALFFNLQRIQGVLAGIPRNPFTAIQSGLGAISGRIPAVVSGFAKLGGAIATGLTIAFAAARDENEKYASDAYSTTEIVKGFFLTLGDNISSIWTTVTDFMVEKFSGVGAALSGALDWLAGAFKNFFVYLTFGFGKLAQGIGLVFKSAFQGIAKQITLLGSAFQKLFAGDFAGAGKAAWDVITFKGVGEAFQQNFTGYLSKGSQEFAKFKTDLQRGYKAIDDQMAAYGARARKGEKANATAKSLTPQEQLESLYSGNLLREGATEDGKGKKKKGRKGRTVDPMKELDRLQRKADDVMKRLAEDNPLLKLQQDFVNDLTEQAQTLLTDGGYAKWMKDIAASGGDAEAAMIDLQDALTGAGADQLVLADLAKRYGVTVDTLTDSLNRQMEAYRYKQEQAKLEAAFGGKLIKDQNEQIHLARLSASEARTMGAVMEEVRKQRERGLKVTQEEINHLTEQLRLRERYMSLLEQEREFYENNGVKTYIADLQTAGEAVHDLDKNFLQSLEDQFTELGTKGTFSIKSIIDSIQGGLARFASQNITGWLAGQLSGGDSKNPSIFGGLFKAMGFDTGFDKNKALQRFDAQNVQLYSAQVSINGDLMSGTLGKSFSGLGGTNGVANDNSIIVNANFADDIESQMKQAMGGAVSDTSQKMRQDWGNSIQSLGGVLQSLLSGAGGGGGGLLGSIVGIGTSLLGGGAAPLARLSGSAASTIAANPGIFKEGGFSNAPVARWSGAGAFSNAPHYSEGTHNTTPGIPAVLHDNEAVIPLSRGRRVPVELTNDRSRGSGTIVNNNFNVSTPNADSFRRSQQQITGQIHRASARAVARNN